MKKLLRFILLLVFLQSISLSQTGLEGIYRLTSETRLEYIEEYKFYNDSLFNFTLLKYQESECGTGAFTITDSALILTFYDVPVHIKDSLRTYYIVNKRSALKGEAAFYKITVLDHEENPLIGSSAQLVDENGYNIVDKIKKYWEADSDGKITVSYPAELIFYGIKVAYKGYETIIIPVKKDSNKFLTVKMLELEKCFHVVEGSTVKKFYLKNVRYSGFYMRGENETEYKYYKKEKE